MKNRKRQRRGVKGKISELVSHRMALENLLPILQPLLMAVVAAPPMETSKQKENEQESEKKITHSHSQRAEHQTK